MLGKCLCSLGELSERDCKIGKENTCRFKYSWSVRRQSCNLTSIKMKYNSWIHLFSAILYHFLTGRVSMFEMNKLKHFKLYIIYENPRNLIYIEQFLSINSGKN